MILVTGATGQLGGAVIDFLLKKVQPGEIAALARNPEKAKPIADRGVDVRVGNYDDPASLERAFAGIHRLLFISSSEIGIRDTQHANVVTAARKTGVGHILYTSFTRTTDEESSPLHMLAATHILTEKLIKESGLTYTFLRNSLYSDALPLFLGDKVVETGTVYFPGGEGKSPFASRMDMAEATANVLTSDGHENQAYPFTNSDAYSFGDIAGMLSEITGKTINYVSPSPEEYKEQMSKVGVPEPVIGLAIGLGLAMQQGITGGCRLQGLPRLLRPYSPVWLQAWRSE